MYRKRKKNDLSTRRLSFNTSIPESPDNSTPLSNKKTPIVNKETKSGKRKSLKNKISTRKSQPGKRSSLGQRNKAKNVSTIQEESDFEVTDLLKKRWKIYRVSPLYNFQESKLKIYGKKLCEDLCSISNKFEYETGFTSLSATFSVTEGFNPLDDNSYALQIKLVTNNNRNNYIGYFISWKKKRQDENFLFLPILLAQGNKGIQNLVHKSICKFFDCDIMPMQLSLKVLAVHLAKYLEIVQAEVEDTEILSLQYRLPGFNQKNIITVTLSVLDSVAVFMSLLHQLEEDPNSTQMKVELYERLLYEKILFHIFRVYSLNLKNAELFKIIFPQCFLTTDGEIKWTTREMLMLGLSLLQEYQEFFSLD